VTTSTQPVSRLSVLLHRPVLLLSANVWSAFAIYLPAHFVFAVIGLALVPSPSKLATIWPSAGLLLAVLTMVRRRMWLGILPAALLAELLGGLWFDRPNLAPDAPLAWLLYAPAVNVFTSTFGAWLYLWGLEPRRPPETSRVLYAFIAVTIAVTIGAVLGGVGLYWREGNPIWDSFLAWWAGDLLGVLAVAPMLLMWWWAGLGYVGRSDGSRWELALIILAAVLVCMFVFGRGDTAFKLPYALFPVLLWAAARFPPRIVSTLGCGIALLAASLHNMGLGPFAAERFPVPESMLPLQAFLGILLATALLVSVSQHERRNLQSRLRDYAQKLTTAEDTARRAAAQDLHDGIGQMLVAIKLKLENARRQGPGDALDRELGEAAQLVGATQQNTRGLLADLSPPGLYEMGLSVALDALVLRLRDNYQLSVRTEYSAGIENLSIHRRIAGYRIARELLTNVVRHAGVSEARLQVSTDGKLLQIVVSDAGRGFDPAPLKLSYWSQSFGLFSIREQVAIEGGTFDVESAPGQGCRISVALPANPLRLNES
jgi:signal transduction histidine kinase